MPQSSESRFGRDPLRIYVLWHPGCAAGADYAGSIFRWFRGDPADLAEAGSGIPVLYRSVPESAGSPAPRPIDAAKAGVNVLVPLVDENMVVDLDWRRYLRAQIKASNNCLFVPVALHKASYHLPQGIDRLNFLRVDRPTDPGSWSPEQRFEVRRRRLNSLLTRS